MKVDFYVLKSNAVEERLLTACKLVQKAYTAGHRVLLIANSDNGVAMDRLLWAFRPQSFIPHKLVTPETVPDIHHYPVIISETLLTGMEYDVVINLSDGPITFPTAPHALNLRLAEIVIQDANILESTRAHYLHYKKMGYLLSTITL